MKKSYLVLVLVLGTTGFGCGGSSKDGQAQHNDEVEGTIKLDDRPLGGAIVRFVPETGEGGAIPGSNAVTDDAGHYKLKCDNGRPGAAIVRHKVVLTRGSTANVDQERNPDPRRGNNQAAPVSADKRPVPSEYGSAPNAKLFVDVTADKHTGYDFNITSNIK